MPTVLHNFQVYPSPSFSGKRGLSPTLSKLLDEAGGSSLLRNLSPRNEQWLAITNHVSSFGFLGLMLTTSEQNRWGFITRDVQDNDQYRYTVFDHLGFCGHGTYHSPEDACIALFDMGYRLVDTPERVEIIAKKCQWYIE